MAAETHDTILKLDDVTKVYSGIVAVKHASLELRRGAVNVLVGENGAAQVDTDAHDRRRRKTLAWPYSS